MIETVTACVRCGNPLTSRQMACRQRYCCQECFHNSKEYHPKKCAYCGGDIPEEKLRRSMGTLKFCTRECYHDSMKEYSETRCQTCGVELSDRQKSKKRKYCSISCRDKGRLPLCKGCGNPFHRKVKEKYCSSDCRRSSPVAKERSEKIRLSKLGKPRDADTRMKLRLARLKQIGDANLFGGQAYPNYNVRACSFFRSLNAALGVNGVHAENGGEYRDRELGYWYDYFCEELKLIIEWDERKHFILAGYRERDIVRNETIAKYRPEYLLIRINQDAPISVDDVVQAVCEWQGRKVVF